MSPHLPGPDHQRMAASLPFSSDGSLCERQSINNGALMHTHLAGSTVSNGASRAPFPPLLVPVDPEQGRVVGTVNPCAKETKGSSILPYYAPTCSVGPLGSPRQVQPCGARDRMPILA